VGAQSCWQPIAGPAGANNNNPAADYGRRRLPCRQSFSNNHQRITDEPDAPYPRMILRRISPDTVSMASTTRMVRISTAAALSKWR